MSSKCWAMKTKAARNPSLEFRAASNLTTIFSCLHYIDNSLCVNRPGIIAPATWAVNI
jgi:hypothetical protein